MDRGGMQVGRLIVFGLLLSLSASCARADEEPVTASAAESADSAPTNSGEQGAVGRVAADPTANTVADLAQDKAFEMVAGSAASSACQTADILAATEGEKLDDVIVGGMTGSSE